MDTFVISVFYAFNIIITYLLLQSVFVQKQTYITWHLLIIADLRIGYISCQVKKNKLKNEKP